MEIYNYNNFEISLYGNRFVCVGYNYQRSKHGSTLSSNCLIHCVVVCTEYVLHSVCKYTVRGCGVNDLRQWNLTASKTLHSSSSRLESSARWVVIYCYCYVVMIVSPHFQEFLIFLDPYIDISIVSKIHENLTILCRFREIMILQFFIITYCLIKYPCFYISLEIQFINFDDISNRYIDWPFKAFRVFQIFECRSSIFGVDLSVYVVNTLTNTTVPMKTGMPLLLGVAKAL